MTYGTWLDASDPNVEGVDERVPVPPVDPEAIAADVARAREAAIAAGFDFVDLDGFEIDPATAYVLPEQRARTDRAVGVGWRYGLPVVAVADPADLFKLDDIYLAAGRDVHIVVASGLQIDHRIDAVYPVAARRRPIVVGPTELVPGREAGRWSWSSGELVAGSPGATPEAEEPDAVEVVDAPAPDAGDLAPAAGDLAPVEDGTPAEDATPFEPVAPPELPAPEPRTEPPSDPAAGGRGLEALLAEAEALVANAELAAMDLLPDAELAPEPPALDEILLGTGKVTKRQMRAALRQQASSGRPLREVVKELGLISDAELHRAVADAEGLELVDLNNWPIDPQASDLLPESLARRYHLLCIGFRAERPVIAMANPSDVFALDDVRSLLGRDVEAMVASPRQIEDYLVRLYRHNEEADEAAQNAALTALATEATQAGEISDLHVVVEDAPIVKFVNLIMRQALNERASDVHIEPTATDLQVRFRVDGVLHEITSAPKTIQGGVVSRLKVMADLDIAEHRVPQDGRLTLTAGTREIDLRVATLPTVHGEKVVLRVLDKSTAPLDLERLGFLPDVLERYAQAYQKPSGTILVTGPTGSGKSTTLYATLNKLNSPERNLISVEDPVEYQLRGINQVQVNPRAGLTFANALRSILRSDPDVVLVGEIRDRETATIAIEAALTGHLVLSCLHTNDAASTPLRLIEMGVEPFLVCSALDCVLAERLARMLCQNCAEHYEPIPEELQAVRWMPSLVPQGTELNFRRAVGCQACSNTGYYGRIAIQEVMSVSEEAERLILARAPTEELKRLAVFEGMRTLHADGIRKAAAGLTSLEEILRVVA